MVISYSSISSIELSYFSTSHPYMICPSCATINPNNARLRHVAGTQWGNKKYMSMKHLETALGDSFIA